jgi:predicted DNA binding protein
LRALPRLSIFAAAFIRENKTEKYMWSLKFSVKNLDSIYSILATKHKITDQFYPLDVYRKGKFVFILGLHFINGEEKAKNAFSAALKKHRQTEKFEQHNDTIIVLIREEEKFYDLLYNPALYHPAPAIIRDGYEQWHVFSWDRKVLEELIAELSKWKNKFADLKIQHLSKTDFSDIYFPKIMPELPVQQKRAFQIAVENGYYVIPRKINLEQAAKIMNVSLSTYQEHLRKAEAKLLPFFGQSH